jgi:hypothetical protein
MGPVTAQTRITNVASKKADGCPVARAVDLAKRPNHERGFVGFMR